MAAATAWYREGTVSVTSGSKAIVGSGTSWLSQVLPGDLFYLADANGNLTSVPAEVDTVSSDTAIALKAIWPGSTVNGVKYGIVRHFNNTLPADLSARLSKLIAGYQITVDQLITLLTSSGQVTITGLDGNNYTVLGLLGYANQVPDHNAADDAHGMTATGRAVLRGDATAGRATLGLVNHEKVAVDSAGVVDLRGVVSRGVAGFIPYIKSRADGSAFGYLDGDYEVANYGWIFGQNNLNGDLRLYRRSAGTSNIEVMNIVRDGVDGGKVYFSNSAQFGGKVSLGGTVSQHQYFYPGVGSFNTGYDYAGGRYVISSDGGGTLTAAQRLTIDAASGKLTVFGEVAPGTDNAHNLGSPAQRLATAYFATNPVIGSDSRLKTDIAEIPSAIAADIMQSLRPVTFRYRVGGQEPYEEDEPVEEKVQVTDPVEVPKTTVHIIEGKAVQITTTETVQQPVYDEIPLVDGDGKPVMQLVTPAVLDEESGEEITPAVYAQAVHREPRMTTVTKNRKVMKYREVEGKRYHAGYIAQEVKAALDAVADRWPPAADLAVWLLSDTADADSTQMVRMEQMTPILHAALRHLHA